MALPGFHPLVSQWFLSALGPPTQAQTLGWAAIRDRRHTLIAAPTGSGKTLAAFLTAIDDLVREGESAGALPDEVRVIYVSPLKALSTDIHKNLAQPRGGIQALAANQGVALPQITTAVRTGDSTSAERAAIVRTPPHVLVTTPESLFLMVTSERSRQMLRTVRTVIVDEIHAVIGTRRGAHLALTLERLQQIAERPFQRLGLSATQKPIDEVARYLVGADESRGSCAIVDHGHRRQMDLAIEMPGSPLDAVMAQEVWEEYYDRLAALIQEHTTTLVFVNTRRLAERLARNLTERLGDEAVTAHHGSLSKETRLDAENRLKSGALKALVATASLELGIDIGHVDLVCQIGSPHRIATLLQRVGRAGHTISGTPKGRLLPTSRDDLVESLALLRAAQHGELDAIVTHDAPLDVLAQQLAAEASCSDYEEDALFALARRAWPYRDLSRADQDAVVTMLAEGYSTRRGRRAALLHRDEVHRRVKGRRGTRMLALTAGGAIPEVADYRVLLEPTDTFLGTLNEDFAIESMAGDVFQLGNASWRITQVTAGTVRVADAQGAPPNIPFWFGEAPARSDELSQQISTLRTEANRQIERAEERWATARTESSPAPTSAPPGVVANDLAGWLVRETGACEPAAQQAAEYLIEGRRVLGVIPSQDTLVLERFFDESGGMQLVLHAPFGSRINKAWALALRKRFCRQFNFELQAAATEDALLLSLGEQHSFPLADVFRYLHPATVRDVLVQAFLDAPVFQTRWRWNATISLAVPRARGGRKVPPQLQRMQAEDLMAAVFPDAAACLENIPGDRQVPDHPLVAQTVRDCLEEAMDLTGLNAVLTRVHAGAIRCVSRDTPEPSAFAHEILNARPYAFLDDAPLEERRAQAVQTRRAGERLDGQRSSVDQSAIARVREEQQPDPRDVDELHDVLLTVGFLVDSELTAADGAIPRELMADCATRGLAARLELASSSIWVAAERLPELLAIHPHATPMPAVTIPPGRAARVWTKTGALVELFRGRLSIVGPTTARQLGASAGVTAEDAEEALLALEADGVVLRGSFTEGVADLEWCERRLLARMHRYTLQRLRAEIAPVSVADFQRFLFDWQHVTAPAALTGVDGLRAVMAQLDGVELPARAWEQTVLPARVRDYAPAMLDMLCLTGEIGWARLSSGPTQIVGATPIALFLRGQMDEWLALRRTGEGGGTRPATARRNRGDGTQRRRGATPGDSHVADQDVVEDGSASVVGAAIIEQLRSRGASFAHDIETAGALSAADVRSALHDLVADGVISSDGFAGLRSILSPDTSRGTTTSGRARAGRAPNQAGRWFCLEAPADETHDLTAAHEMLAWVLLRRYGVVFRRLLTREATGIAWRDLARVYRRLEARGDIRGGRFVTGMSGEQFALPDAVERLREIRRTPADDTLVTISAADPLNLVGIITEGERIRVAMSGRIVFHRGVAVYALEGDMLRSLSPVDEAIAEEAAAAAAGRRVPVLSGYVGRM
jgi:ATP-dependent Lhr-like helicase